MNNKKIKVWLIILLVSIAVLFLLGLVSSALEIGERLRNIHFSLEIAFYTIIGIVILVGIIYPITGVFFEPVFSLDQLHDANGNVKQKWCRKLVKNLIENTDLTPEEQQQVRGFLKEGNNADDRLIEFFDRKIAPEINREIFKSARRAFIVTAVSQNSIFDMLGMASLNFMLIKKITELCGFRPTNLQIVRLYIKVLSMTVVAGILEEVDMENVISKVAESALGSSIAKIVGVAASSLLQGTTSALATLRVGTVTKNYLLNADVSKTRSEIRKEAFKESMAVFPSIVKEEIDNAVKKPANKIKDIVVKAKDRVAGNMDCDSVEAEFIEVNEKKKWKLFEKKDKGDESISEN